MLDREVDLPPQLQRAQNSNLEEEGGHKFDSQVGQVAHLEEGGMPHTTLSWYFGNATIFPTFNVFIHSLIATFSCIVLHESPENT